MLRGGRALGLSYQRFWRPLPLASGRRGGYCLAYERDMVREAMDEMACRGPVAWVRDSGVWMFDAIELGLTQLHRSVNPLMTGGARPRGGRLAAAARG